jgi:hypothetical protein
MLRVADDYDMLADRADVRGNGGVAVSRDCRQAYWRARPAGARAKYG